MYIVVAVVVVEATAPSLFLRLPQLVPTLVHFIPCFWETYHHPGPEATGIACVCVAAHHCCLFIRAYSVCTHYNTDCLLNVEVICY